MERNRKNNPIDKFEYVIFRAPSPAFRYVAVPFALGKSDMGFTLQ
jgi:hypothetical protein